MKTRKVQAFDWDNIAKALGLSSYEAHEALPTMAVLVCPPGTRIIREGEPGVDVYIVGKGSLEVTHSSFVFFSKKVAALSTGDFFGEVGFLIEQGRTATVTTVGPAEIYRILADEMQTLIEKRADVRLRLEESARQRVQALSAAISGK